MGKAGKVSPAGGASPGAKEQDAAGEGKGSRPPVQVFCYVNSVFAPALDEGVGGLWKVSAGSSPYDPENG